jgi:hypothetical protein
MFNISSGYRSHILFIYVEDSVFDRSHVPGVIHIPIDQFWYDSAQYQETRRQKKSDGRAQTVYSEHGMMAR